MIKNVQQEETIFLFSNHFFLCLKHSHICIKTRETEKITKSNVKNNNKKKT